jgi:valyl-tRNA synthetase
VHRSAWPTTGGLTFAGADADLITDLAAVLTQVRKAKSEAGASMKAEVSSAVITAPATSAARLALAEGDIKAVGRIAELSFADGAQIDVAVTLAPTE